MAAPSFLTQTIGFTDPTGAWNTGLLSWGTTVSIGDVCILQILQDGTTNGAVTVTNTSGVESLPGAGMATQITGPNGDGSFPIGSSEVARQFLWIGRITVLGTSTVQFLGGNSTSEDIYLRAYCFQNVSTGTTLATVIENAVSYLTSSSYSEIGNTAATEARAQSFIASPDNITKVAIRLWKIGSPTDNLIVEIQSNTSGPKPSGTVVSTIATLDGNSLTNTAFSLQELSCNVSLTAGTKYWLVVRRSGAVNASNRYGIGASDINYADGGSSAYNTGAWTNEIAFDTHAFAISPYLTRNTNATDGTITDAGVTTLGPDRLALQFIGISDDNALAAFTGETGGDWTEAVAEYAEASGTDATIGLQIAYPALAAHATGGGEVGFTGDGAGGFIERVAESFSVSSGATATRVRVPIRTEGTPTGNVIAEIQTDSAGSPSGTVVGSGASVAAASIPSTAAWIEFAINATLSASTTYWVVLRRSAAQDGTNYFVATRSTSDTYSGGSRKVRTAGTWGSDTGDLTFTVESSAGTTINGGTTTNADATDGWGVVGFALIGTTTVSPPPSAVAYKAKKIVTLI